MTTNEQLDRLIGKSVDPAAVRGPIQWVGVVGWNDNSVLDKAGPIHPVGVGRSKEWDKVGRIVYGQIPRAFPWQELPKSWEKGQAEEILALLVRDLPMIIEAQDYPWKYQDADAAHMGRYLPGLFRIPGNVTVRFPNGDEYDSTGGPEGRSESDCTREGSPVHQALVAAGITLERVQ